MTTILLTAATGTVGSAMLDPLLTRGARVRALVRDPDRAGPLAAAGATVVRGDFADPASLRPALVGVDAVFLACGNVPDQVQLECTVVDEAVRAGVERVVKLSARGAAVDAGPAYWRTHGLIEQHLRAAAIGSVQLRPGFAMSNLLAAAGHVQQAGRLFAPAGGARIAMIDPRDVAAAAVAALTADASGWRRDHEGRVHVLTGPAAIGYAEVAADLSAVLGRPVGYVDVPVAPARAALEQAGLPPFAAQRVLEVFEALRAGEQATTTDTVRALTGRSPGAFADFARRHVATFTGPLAPVPG